VAAVGRDVSGITDMAFSREVDFPVRGRKRVNPSWIEFRRPRCNASRNPAFMAV